MAVGYLHHTSQVSELRPFKIDVTKLFAARTAAQLSAKLAGRLSKSYTEAEQPPADGAERRIADVLDQDVLRVLDRHGAHLLHTIQHREYTRKVVASRYTLEIYPIPYGAHLLHTRYSTKNAPVR